MTKFIPVNEPDKTALGNSLNELYCLKSEEYFTKLLSAGGFTSLVSSIVAFKLRNHYVLYAGIFCIYR